VGRVGSSNLLISSKQKKSLPEWEAIFLFQATGKPACLSHEETVLVMGAEPSAACGGESEAKAQ
jgi:hypothetical protein